MKQYVAVLLEKEESSLAIPAIFLIMLLTLMILLIELVTTVPHETGPYHSYHTDNSKIQYINIGQTPAQIRHTPDGTPGEEY